MGKALVFGAIGAVVLILLVIAYLVWAGSSSDEVAVAAAAPKLPAGLVEGDVIHCQKTSGVFKIVNGKRSWFPSPAIWAKYGTPQYRDVDCDVIDSIPAGPNMEHMSASAVFKPEHMSASAVFKPEHMTTIADVYKA